MSIFCSFNLNKILFDSSFFFSFKKHILNPFSTKEQFFSLQQVSLDRKRGSKFIQNWGTIKNQNFEIYLTVGALWKKDECEFDVAVLTESQPVKHIKREWNNNGRYDKNSISFLLTPIATSLYFPSKCFCIDNLEYGSHLPFPDFQLKFGMRFLNFNQNFWLNLILQFWYC